MSILALLTISACDPRQSETPSRDKAGDTIGDVVADRLDELLQQALSDTGMPAIGIVVANSGGIANLRVMGVRRSDTLDALRKDDPFHIGSVSKPFTATVIGQLVEEGKLKWDSPVAAILPDIMASAQPAFEGVTLAHLLAHEAGLQPMEEDEELAGVPPLSGDVVSQRRQFARWVFQQDPIVPPLEEYRYSNAHFVVAAAMAEEVSGEPWEVLVRSRIFDALGMQRAGFGWPGRTGEHAPWGHRPGKNGDFGPVDPNGDYALPEYFGPAGDVHASLGDIGLFLPAYLLSWQENGRLLAGDTVRHMLVRRMRGGLGWGSTEAFGYEPVATYSGSADTFLMIVAMIPDANFAVAVAANAFSDEVEAAIVKVLRESVQLYLPQDD